MKLKPTNGNIRIVELVKDLHNVMLAHDDLAVKHGITIFNLKYLLRKMVDMGIIEIERTRNLQGQLEGSSCQVLIWPELELKEEKPKKKLKE